MDCHSAVIAMQAVMAELLTQWPFKTHSSLDLDDATVGNALTMDVCVVVLSSVEVNVKS